MLRTVDGRSPHGSETDRGDVRAASPTFQLHVAVADRVHRPRPFACDDDDNDGEAAPENATVVAVPNFTSARRTATPSCRLPVSAVADGDERRDASPDIGDAGPERPGITTPDTRDEHGDRIATPFVIAEPLRFDPVAVQPTVAWSPRSHDRLPQTILPAFESGLALTPLLAPLKSRLYGGAAFALTPHAPEGAELF